MDETFPLVPVLNLLALLLVLIPLSRTMFSSWNIGVCMYAIWVAMMALDIGVNTIVWRNNVNDVAPVWCDLVTHLQMGSVVGIPACSLVMTRRLFRITRLREVVPDKRKRRIELVIDLFLCVGLPVIVMALYVIGQGARYQIIEELGCMNALYPSVLTLLIVNIGPLLLPLISLCYYSPQIIWTLYKHRKEVDEFLSSSNLISKQSYYRVMALACFDMLVTFPNQSINFVFNLTVRGLTFWPGWQEVHLLFSQVVVAPADEWKHGGNWLLYNVRWAQFVNVFLSVVFFALFGLTEEARKRYRRLLFWAGRPFGVKESVKSDISNVVFGSHHLNVSVSRDPTVSTTESLDSDHNMERRSKESNRITTGILEASDSALEKGVEAQK